MSIHKLYKILVVLTALIISGCADEATCIPENTDLLQIAFVDTDGTSSELIFQSLELIANGESFVFEGDTTATLAIALNPLDSMLELKFIRSDITNVLKISYNTLPGLIDPKCGLETLFDGVQIDSTNFIATEVVDPTLNKDISINVKITH